MKKQYIKPKSMSVKVNLYGSLLEKPGTVGGQSNNPTSSDPNPDDVVFSGKDQPFTDDEDNNSWGSNSRNIWND